MLNNNLIRAKIKELYPESKFSDSEVYKELKLDREIYDASTKLVFDN